MKYISIIPIFLSGLLIGCSLHLDDDRAGATITTNKTASVEGYVISTDSLALRKMAFNQDSIADVIILVKLGTKIIATDRSDLKGHYRIDSLEPGTYDIQALIPDAPTITISGVSLKTNSVTVQIIWTSRLVGNGSGSSQFIASSSSEDIPPPLSSDLVTPSSSSEVVQSVASGSSSSQPSSQSSSSQPSERCPWLTETNFTHMLVADSGGSWLADYDSLQLQKTGSTMLSNLWVHGDAAPVSANYTSVIGDTLVGRNGSLAYDEQLIFDKSCTVRYTYRYDRKGFWEGPYRWIEQ